jgi:hypothetical protein
MVEKMVVLKVVKKDSSWVVLMVDERADLLENEMAAVKADEKDAMMAHLKVDKMVTKKAAVMALSMDNW